MNKSIIAFISGLCFGMGLTLSQMANPEKVLAFLDLAGAFDPSLALVMVGALAVAAVAFHWILKRPSPVFDKTFHFASKTAVDRSLLFGAALFGIGWGMSGYCPGPVVAGLGLGNWEAIPVLIAIFAGFYTHKKIHG